MPGVARPRNSKLPCFLPKALAASLVKVSLAKVPAAEVSVIATPESAVFTSPSPGPKNLPAKTPSAGESVIAPRSMKSALDAVTIRVVLTYPGLCIRNS